MTVATDRIPIARPYVDDSALEALRDQPPAVGLSLLGRGLGGHRARC